MLLNLVHDGLRLRPVDEVDGDATLAEPSRSPDPVQVGLAVRLFVDVYGQVVVDHDGDGLHVNAPGDDVGRDQKSPRADNLLIRLVKFANNTEEVHGWKMLTQLSESDYEGILASGGMTALCDAAVDITESVALQGEDLMQNELNCNGIIFVITDGCRTAGKCQNNHVKSAQEDTTRKERLESCRSVLIGVNATAYSAQLQDFKDEGGFDQYVELADAEKGTLAKLAEFVSQSISSTSTALVNGQPSVPIDPSTVF